MGDEDNGFARKTRKQICDDLRLGRRIQRGKRLVKQQNIAAEGKQAREGDPLALTARHLVRALVGKRRRAADAERIERCGAVMLRLRQPHVFKRVERREEPRLLKQHRDPAVCTDRAAVRRLQPRDQTQHRGFAPPALADERGDPAVGKMQRAVVEHGAIKTLGHMFKGDAHFAPPLESRSRRHFSSARLTRMTSSV